MLSKQIREAREQHGLSQARLARLANVHRTQLRQLEEGGNVTLETLAKVVAQLPNLRSLSLGAVQLHTGAIDPTAARQILIDLITAAGRALTLFEPAVPAPPPAGATRYDGAAEITPELEARLRQLEALLPREASEEG
jgi:transcriptional regulator with XRE-family HTH domain